VNGSSASSTLTVYGGSLQIGSVSGGTYVVTAGGTIDFAGSLASGTIVRLAGGTIKLDTNSNLQSGDSFAFSGSTASTLDVVSSNNFQNGFGYAVTGFDHGDRMRFGTLNLTGDNAVYSSGNSTLTVRNGGQTVLTLSNLSLASDVAPPIKFNLVLPHPGMLPSHGPVASPGCSRSTIAAFAPTCSGARRRRAVLCLPLRNAVQWSWRQLNPG